MSVPEIPVSTERFEFALAHRLLVLDETPMVEIGGVDTGWHWGPFVSGDAELIEPDQECERCGGSGFYGESVCDCSGGYTAPGRRVGVTIEAIVDRDECVTNVVGIDIGNQPWVIEWYMTNPPKLAGVHIAEDLYDALPAGSYVALIGERG